MHVISAPPYSNSFLKPPDTSAETLPPPFAAGEAPGSAAGFVPPPANEASDAAGALFAGVVIHVNGLTMPSAAVRREGGEGRDR